MRKFTLQKKLLAIVALLIAGSIQGFAQHEILVPSQANFYDVIMGDTVADGSRRDPLAIYILKRGDVYKVDRSMAIGFNFTLKGEPGDDATTMPAVLVPQLNIEGSYPDNYFHIAGDNLTITLENFILQGIPSDYEHKVTGVIATVAITEKGDSCRMLMDNVVITGFANHAVQDESKGGYAKFTNCTFRNVSELKDEWGGTGLGHWNQVGTLDSLIVQNCTFFNVQCGVIATTEIYKHILVDHNTFFGSITGFGGMGGDQISNVITNNIFFGSFGQGVPKREVPLWTDEEGVFQGPSIFEFDTIRAPRDQYIKDAWGIDDIWDRNITIENNLIWWPEILVETWDTLDYDGGAVAHPVVINPWGKRMIEDHPGNFIIKDTITDTDPQFDQATIDRYYDIALDWIWNRRHTEDWPGYYKLFDAEEHMYQLEWPLPENLRYKNEALLTAGTDGKPLGDLNWFPEYLGVDENEGSNNPSQIELNNYPNPFNGTTTIEYTIRKSAEVSVTIYDVFGKQVKVLVNKNQNAGTHQVIWDGSQLSEGFYFCQLKIGARTITKKMILTNKN